MKAPVAALTSEESSSSPSPVPNLEQDVLIAPYSALLEALTNKQKYLEARVEKLQKFDEEAKQGKELTKDKEVARLCLPDVKNQIGFLSAFQKKMVEKQRDFNRKNKQRLRTQKQETSQLRVTTAIDVLTARYTLACYKNLEGQRRVADAFTAEERVRLDMISKYFLPEIAPGTCVASYFQKNKDEIDAILGKNETYMFENGCFSGADAYNLLQTLKPIVEDMDYCTSSAPAQPAVSEVRNHHPQAVETPTPINSAITTPDGIIQPTTTPASSPECASPIGEPVSGVVTDSAGRNISFGYFSDTSSKPDKVEDKVESTPVEKKEVTETAEAVEPANGDAKTDDKKEAKKPRGGANRRRGAPRKPFAKKTKTPSESTSENADKENKKEVGDKKPRAERGERPPRPPRQDKNGAINRDAKPANGAPRAQGAPRGGFHNNGQRRFNGPPREKQETGKVENGGGLRQANGFNKSQGNSAGQKAGYKSQGYKNASNNGYREERDYGKGDGYNVPTGYIRQGGYIRPPPGACGFVLQMKQ